MPEATTFAESTRSRWAGVRGALFIDQYELVMAQLYVRDGIAGRRAQFDYFFRSTPDYGTHQAGYCVTAGLGPFLEWLGGLRFTDEDLAALRSVTTATGERVFGEEFLAWLRREATGAELEIHAVREGRVVHPHEPVISVVGPLAVAQLVETSLLNHLNYATLIATKAARIVQSARTDRVLEFGMRRGPGAGVNEGIRAALIGGCSGTSNVEAALALGGTPRGTHAHSLVQAYIAIGEGELGAFRAMARSSPDDCVLLVDTIDTLHSGVPNAIRVFEELRAAGHRPAGVRLDSGDLAYLAVRTAVQLDAAGFDEVPIVLSGDLDELNIWQILTQIDDDAGREGIDGGAVRRRLVYGVGTRLITSHGDPALNGVYKLVGLEDEHGGWVPAIKISENPAKVPIPGRKQLWRLYDRRQTAFVDLVGTPDDDPLRAPLATVHHPTREGVHSVLDRDDVARVEPLHEMVFDGDVRGGLPVPIEELRRRCREDVAALDVGVRRLVNPHRYHVSLTADLFRRRRQLIEGAGAPPAGGAPA